MNQFSCVKLHGWDAECLFGVSLSDRWYLTKLMLELTIHIIADRKDSDV